MMKQTEVPQTEAQRLQRSSLTERCETSMVEGEGRLGAEGRSGTEQIEIF